MRVPLSAPLLTFHIHVQTRPWRVEALVFPPASICSVSGCRFLSYFFTTKTRYSYTPNLYPLEIEL